MNTGTKKLQDGIALNRNRTFLGRLNSFVRNQLFFLFIVIVILVAVVGALNPRFLTASNILSIFQQIAVLGIATMAMALLLISGQIDLSIGSIMGLSAVIICTLVMNNVSTTLAVLAGFLVAVFCGFINGVIVTKSRCIPLIVTLGMSYVYYGMAMVISKGLFLTLRGKFQFLGRGEILGVPVPMIILIALSVLTHVVLKYTKYGRRLVVMGGNEEVAFLAGISVEKLKILTYTLSGAIVGIAALVLVSRLGNALANIGNGYELKALAAAIIGGVTFEGGRGTVAGTFLGVILIGILTNALNILGISTYYQTVVFGGVIVSAVIASNIGALRK